jgi:hypothetical protein
MATRDSSGVERRRVRLDANRPRTHPKHSRRKPAKSSKAAIECGGYPERLGGPRGRLFKAMSIIACCRLSCASLLDSDGDLEVMTDALQAAYDLIDETAGELEVIGSTGGAP